MKFVLSVLLGLYSLMLPNLAAQGLSKENNSPETGIAEIMPLNFPKIQIEIKTLGGRQFWGDLRFHQGYRIQQNVLTKHCRLLDPHDVRKAWGTLAECEQSLAIIAEKEQVPPMQGKAVVLIHGIIRSSKSFSRLARKLREDGYTVIGFDYPSTRMTMKESTHYLSETIASLEGIEQIDFVCHSMGGLLVRAYLLAAGEQVDPRIHRMVMLGTPNRGAEMANLMQKNWMFQWIFGPAGQELIVDEQGTIASLPIPQFEFGIIAGARGTTDGWNPLIPGDDDGTVSVDSSQLVGAKDFTSVKSLHSFLPEDTEGIEAVRRFLKTGCFRESGLCTPISRQSDSKTTPANGPNP